MKLPKMYAPVMLRFPSLSWTVSGCGGISEVDVVVVRKCRRVIGRYGEWVWQLVLSPCQLKDKNCFGKDDVDQESLNNYRDEFEIIP